MSSRRKVIVGVCVAILVLLVVGQPTAFAAGQRATVQRVSIGTASAGGSWYPIGQGLAAILNDALEGIEFDAPSTGGAPENIDMIRSGEMEFGLNYPMVSTPAFEGRMAFQGQAWPEFRSVMTLFENVQSPVVLRRHVRTGNVVDLEGLRFNVGTPGSGTALEWELITSVLGINLREEFLSFADGAQGLRDGTIDGASLNAAIPHATIQQLIAEGVDIAILDFNEDQYQRLIAELDYTFFTKIPAGTYQGIDVDIPMIAQSTFLFTGANVSEDLVYRVTKAIFENEARVRQVHGAMRRFSRETALDGLKQPLHVGAYRYYREIGLAIPDELVPPEAR